jgi:O-antigen/teichoic acid export membrane protein
MTDGPEGRTPLPGRSGEPVRRRAVELIFWRSLGLMASAIGSIWAARCLGPEKLGVSGVVISLAGFAALLVTAGIDFASIRTLKECRERADVLRFVRMLTAFRTMLAAGIMLVAAGVVAGLALAGRIELGWWLAIGAALPMVYLQGNAATWVLQAQENQLAQYRIAALQTAAMAFVYLLVFRPSVATGADVFVQMLGTALGFGLAWRTVRRELPGIFARPGWADLRAGFRYLARERWVAGASVVVYLYTTFNLPLVGFFSSTAEAGLYRAAMNLALSVGALLLIYSSVIYPRVLAWRQETPAELWSRQVQAARKLLPWLVALLAGATLVAPRMIPFLMGSAFSASTAPFCLLVAAKCVTALSSTFIAGVRAQRRDRELFFLLSVAAVGSVAAGAWIFPRLGAVGAAAVALASELFVFAGGIVLTRRGSRPSS